MPLDTRDMPAVHCAVAWPSYCALTQTYMLHTQAVGTSAVNHCLWSMTVVDIIQTCSDACILSCVAVNVWKQSHRTMTSRYLIVCFVVLGENMSSVIRPADNYNLYLAQFWVAAQGPKLEISQGTIKYYASVCAQQESDL